MNNQFNNNNNFLIHSDLIDSNIISQQTLEEQRLMRKAYCKANNIPYEEPEEIPPFVQGFLKVLLIILFLFAVGTGISALIASGDFLKLLLDWWF